MTNGPTICVLDTNACLLPFTDGTDLAEGLTELVGRHDLVVPQPVQDELLTLAKDRGARGQAARGALSLLKGVPREPTIRPGDEGVLDVAIRLGAWLVTNDGRLRGEASRRHVRVVASRDGGRLHIA